jgi:4-hydroxy-tetrahydrodipicolinate reductase
MEKTDYLPKQERIRVGLVGFGKTGRAVASVLLQDKTIDLVWVLRKTQNLEHRSVPEFLGIESDEEGEIHWIGDVDCESLIESAPVDAIIDFSSEEGMDYYGEAAAESGITIISAISQLPPARVAQMHGYAKTTRVLWSPNITLGINFMIVAAKTLQQIAPHADISILEEQSPKFQEQLGRSHKPLTWTPVKSKLFAQAELLESTKSSLVFHSKLCALSMNQSREKLLVMEQSSLFRN